MRLSLIWAMAKNRTIGRNNALPWKLPDEMRHFVRSTRGKPVIMGRKQFEAMPRALPNRKNIVLSRDVEYRAAGAEVVPTFDRAVEVAESWAIEHGADEIMVIGGAEIYALALRCAARLYMTVIDAEIEGDTFFPSFDETQFREVHREDHPVDERHAYRYSIRVLDRTDGLDGVEAVDRAK